VRVERRTANSVTKRVKEQLRSTGIFLIIVTRPTVWKFPDRIHIFSPWAVTLLTYMQRNIPAIVAN